MQDIQGFRPAGNTAMLMGSTASPLANLMMSTPPRGDVAYLIYNSGAVDAFLGYGMTSGAANGNAVVPVAGTSTPTLPVPAGQWKSFTLTPNLFFCAVTPSGNAPVYITPGMGM